MTFELGFCPTCRVVDCKVVISLPIPLPVPGWGEVGPYFDKYIMHTCCFDCSCSSSTQVTIVTSQLDFVAYR